MVAGRPGTGMAMPPPQTGMRTAMGTAAGGGAGFGGGIREGKFTEQVYSMIRDKRYHEAIAVLSGKVMEFPNSRAAASLIAYCYYYVADYASAIAAYERLVKLCPDVETYKLYLAQALFKGGHYDAATKACQAVGDSEELSHKVMAPLPPRAAAAARRRPPGRPPARRRVPTPPGPSSSAGAAAAGGDQVRDGRPDERARLHRAVPVRRPPQPTNRRPASECTLTPLTSGPTRPTPSSTTRA